jgi:hypothetical protein
MTGERAAAIVAAADEWLRARGLIPAVAPAEAPEGSRPAAPAEGGEGESEAR